MPEVLVEFSDAIPDYDGNTYMARACGVERPDGMWSGWIEFVPTAAGDTLRTGRETTQPNRQDTYYWATGLSRVYLEGALRRALDPAAVRATVRDLPTPEFDGPAPLADPAPPAPDSVLNPFSVYRKGEQLLRRQLSALSDWHLVNIVRDYQLTDKSLGALNAMTPVQLVELIVQAVRHQDAMRGGAVLPRG
jgi:hypothetical protein